MTKQEEIMKTVWEYAIMYLSVMTLPIWGGLFFIRGFRRLFGRE